MLVSRCVTVYVCAHNVDRYEQQPNKIIQESMYSSRAPNEIDVITTEYQVTIN